MPAGARVHPLAVVDPRAELGADVDVGPLCVVEAGAVVGAGTTLASHAIVRSGARVGARCSIDSFTVVGGAPQDRSDDGVDGLAVVGDDCVLREHVTVHRGTAKGRGATRVGAGTWLMAGCHVAHDAQVGARATLANGTLLGGHVELDDGVVTGGHVAIAPFVRVGRLAFLGGAARVERDVPPFVIAAGDRARVRALNDVGLARAGYDERERRALAAAFRAIYKRGTPIAVAAAGVLRELEASSASASAIDAGRARDLVRELAEACAVTTPWAGSRRRA